MQTADRLSGIGEYYFSQKGREIEELNRLGKRIINLGIGSPDLAPHASVVEVLNRESTKPHVHGYQGYKGVPALRLAISRWYDKWYQVSLDPDTEVLPLIGSKEGILHVCMTYLSEGDEALIPDPGYPTYGSAVKLAGGVCKLYDLKESLNWMPDFEALERLDLSRTKLMWVNYPHMPTGQLPDDRLFTDLIEFGKKHNILICHDNPYSFILNDKPMSLLSVDGAKETAIELNSLSKSHNMAGWRIGMLCGGAERINEVLRFKSNMDSGMFLPVQLAAAQALSLGEEWHRELNSIYRARREKVFVLLDLLECSYTKVQTGLFVWAKIPSHVATGFQLSDKVLQEASVFITPGGIFGSAGAGFIRISLCSSADLITEAIERISKLKS
ncbi:MAG: aminotransferase class I/II-fold pyridoxal phosphate-dependent enzyme [Chitinophagaceae bacterium]